MFFVLSLSLYSDFATDALGSIGFHCVGTRKIEGKIGQIIDQETGERIQLPVRNETIVDLSRTRFDSRMTVVSLFPFLYSLGLSALLFSFPLILMR